MHRIPVREDAMPYPFQCSPFQSAAVPPLPHGGIRSVRSVHVRLRHARPAPGVGRTGGSI